MFSIDNVSGSLHVCNEKYIATIPRVTIIIFIFAINSYLFKYYTAVYSKNVLYDNNNCNNSNEIIFFYLSYTVNTVVHSEIW